MLGKFLKRIRAGTRKLAINDASFIDVSDSIVVTSSCFPRNGYIPEIYTQMGKNLSPAIEWNNPPFLTKSIVVFIEDADAPLPVPFLHGVAYNIMTKDAANGGLQEGSIPSTPYAAGDPLQHGLDIGRNMFGKTTYIGPAPIAGHGLHRYFFQVFALDGSLSFPQPPKRKDVIKSMAGHVLAKGCLVGVYER